jgi:tetratricopeptide (TPR) repeat protein
MGWRLILAGIFVVFCGALPLRADSRPLQQQYLDIYLKINDAEHLEKQNDYRGALEDFKDCYQKLARIHQNNPEWETALVVHRMDDCKAKILDLQPKADAQPASVPPPPGMPVVGGETNNGAPMSDSDENAQLKVELQAVNEDLRITKDRLAQSESQKELYRTQLEAVNQQLAALKNQQSVDERMGKLLNQNQDLSNKLAEAEKELDVYRNNPKSKLAQAEAQVKNLQDQLAASQEANKALQDTTLTLKQQLDQANSDLVTANQKLAAAAPGTAEYTNLKRDNELMRGILTRELQEQAHRDMARRLYQEEYDRLKLNSKVLQETVDELASPMTPPSSDDERQLLASLRNPAPDVATPAPASNTFSAPAGPASTNAGDTNAAPATPTPPAPGADTNAASATSPAQTNAAPATTGTTVASGPTTGTDTSTNGAPVQIVMNAGDASTTNAPSATTDTTTASAPPSTPPDSATSTNTPTAAGPIPPTTAGNQPPPDVPANPPATATPPAVPDKTVAQLPPAQSQSTDTTVTTSTTTPTDPNDPTQYSTKARLPDDMRETAQEAADLFKNQKYDESAAKYQSIIDKYPESLYAWSNLGVVRFQQGKFDDALKALQQAVKLSPTDAFSYSNLGIVYYQLNQFENAIDALNAAKALDPNDPKTHNYLGCACSQKGWQEVAEKEFRKAIELDPNFGDAHFNLALVYATQKPPALELARREYNKALELGIAKDARLEKLLDGTGASASAQPAP